jgi:hypothetical protein
VAVSQIRICLSVATEARSFPSGEMGRVGFPRGLADERAEASAGSDVPEGDELVHVETGGGQGFSVGREDDAAVADVAEDAEEAT